MIKKPYYILTVFIILTLLFGIVFANVAPDKTASGSNIVNNSHNTMIVTLNIDYGRANTQSNYVTLNLNVTGQDVNLNSLKVQFSSDNKNWKGYDSFTQKWEDGLWGTYQSFYSGFYIGTDSGLKTVYTRVIDTNGNIGLASAKINYSPDTHNPYIANPQSLELNDFQGPLIRAGIKNGSGSLYDPYIISSNNTRLVFKMPNAAEICYYMDKGAWSPWYKITNEQVDIPIVFNNVEGVKEVRLRSKNQYGVEGDAEIIYYLLDYSKPTVQLHTNYHSFIAVDGKLQLDLEMDDNLSNVLDFEIEICSGGNSTIKKGKIEKYDKNKSMTTSVTIEGLPKGQFDVKATVMDEAGNRGTRRVSVNSL
ncbi:MAG: hypothetical protein ACOCG5_07320 [Candidatus Alkaliphilus sp. MAG34]|nr:hypothetical protein [Clostridiales bacterium]